MKKVLQLQHPLYVRRISMPKGYDGDCRLLKKGFLIRIEKSFPEHYAMDVLIHEIGHVLSWDKEEDVHGLAWGKAYSIVYRTYLEWNEIQLFLSDNSTD